MNDIHWEHLFVDVVKYTVLPNESIDDVVAGGFVLGQQRAKLLSRAFSPAEDVAHALCIFCWWPFKPALDNNSTEYLHKIRRTLFQAASSSDTAVNKLRNAVPSKILVMSTQELIAAYQEGPVWNVLGLGVHK
jgi:hypothetical protein